MSKSSQSSSSTSAATIDTSTTRSTALSRCTTCPHAQLCARCRVREREGEREERQGGERELYVVTGGRNGVVRGETECVTVPQTGRQDAVESI
jgi:hypothetical protein